MPCYKALQNRLSPQPVKAVHFANPGGIATPVRLHCYTEGRYGNREEHSRDRQRHEHNVHGDVPAHHRRELSRWPRPHARRDVPGPLSRYARACSATKTGWRSAWPVSCARPPARPTASTSRRRRTPTTSRISGGERYAKVYNIDYNRCIFCGYCVEACPTDAITHGHGFELATYNASTLIYRKEQLLAGTPAHEGANAVFSQYEVGRLVPKK